jgi:PAS domain S-box-containing protein
MTQGPRTEPSSEAQAAKLRGILESAVTAILTIDDRVLIENINPATERLFGYQAAELVGQNVKVLMPEPYKDEHDGYIANYLGTGVKKIIGIGREVRGRRKDGTTFPLYLSVSEFSADGRRYFTGMIHDLSDRKHVEEALRESERRLAQAQKMEAVGQLTGGIAHDFNNLLLVVTGNLELLDLKLDRDEQRALLKEAQDAAILGSKLTDQLLTFARRRHMDSQVIQLNEQVIGIADVLRRPLGNPRRPRTVPERRRQHGGERARCHAAGRQARDRDPQHRARCRSRGLACRAHTR